MTQESEPKHNPLQPPIDLTGQIRGIWPANTLNRAGSFYFDLQGLPIMEGQTGLIGAIAPNFVFERVDLHCTHPVDTPLSLEMMTGGLMAEDKMISLGLFSVVGNQVTCESSDTRMALSGSYMSQRPVYICLHSPMPETGRIMINFIGYLIEPWR